MANDNANRYWESDEEEDQEAIKAAEDYVAQNDAAEMNAQSQDDWGFDENGQRRESPDEPLGDADIADVNDTVHMQTGGKAGIEGPKSRDMQMLRDSRLKSVGDRASGGGIVVGTGMRKADDRSWEKDYNAMLQRKAAARAGRQAAADERQALLDSGRYFDDGRGNIKLKKEFRERQRTGNGGRRTYNETIADDGSANRAMQRAYNNARDGFQFALAAQEDDYAARSLEKTLAMQSSNKAQMQAIQKQKDDAAKNRAKGMLSIYDGMAAAYKDLIDEANAGRIQDEMRTVYGDFKKDQQGRVTTERETSQKATGRKFRNGFVAPADIADINESLRRRGVGMEITGIVAQELYNDVSKKGEGGPSFLVQGYRWDERNGMSVPFGHRFSLEDVYRFGVDKGEAAGIEKGRAEQNVARTLKDIYGILPQMGSDRVQVANIEAASAERIADKENETRIRVAEIQQGGQTARTDMNNKNKVEVEGIRQKGQNERTDMNLAAKEEIEKRRETGRQARAVMRDKVAWEKLANEKAKIDNNFAVQMKRADTYGKRVDLIESKINHDYEIALKKAATAERKLEIEEKFKELKNEIDEGRLDLDWFKADNMFELGMERNAETERHNRANEEIALEKLRTKANGGDRVAESDLKEAMRLHSMLSRPTGRESEESLANMRTRYNEILTKYGNGNKADVKQGDNSGNGTTVTTQEPPNGQYEVEKDGKKYHWGKSKSGKWGYFPNK